MSYCKQQGKDKVIFVTKEDHDVPSTTSVQLFGDLFDDDEPGLILPNGDINWNCPCLGGVATGPCGIDFREAFSCFHYSKADPKGSDCFNQFQQMQTCMVGFPDVYPRASGGDDDDDDDDINLDNLDINAAETNNDVTNSNNNNNNNESSKSLPEETKIDEKS